ncbi:Mitochondrial import inner membrane translocase subunit tim8 [Exophiala dermatitidis]|uniref:Mitochondrial import inner membrane translocase subunit n=2 Tax=Exophiala dermatitidis TaxID=5970 RepID=H6BYX4_EXODN|nr:uncharacterized protein HMPREF1120_04901 [Exophiala dermatitidis NIH/UT8656]KAJ4520123.1 Mitochondrial import inner membrane translocase subunit tim8 [Exophiala dermatitidis]EHY56837.1 hypothetical protein HMPREF1120_04901 [Exophiala dermatitidis NIH/UT8656]KAJ4523968.1 Mitochondrial import inner membrane translocase subunit tim8 [Exophiala dermatitidis]KAJ4525761.1 Mitochondrial import inner membrane translocase subunit tim8 [Exophiala dermatitidis]KAJ4537090.1 Mitochondrial import inner m
MDDVELNITQQDIARLTPAEQSQLQTFVQVQMQRAQIQKNIHEMTEMCFKKCITGSISGGKLAPKEETCMSNCVERFMDTNVTILKHLDAIRAGQ